MLLLTAQVRVYSKKYFCIGTSQGSTMSVDQKVATQSNRGVENSEVNKI